MFTATEVKPDTPAQSGKRTLGPTDHGQELTCEEFTEAEFSEGWLYELARGIVVVTEVPGIHHGRIVGRVTVLFVSYELTHPGIINCRAGVGECRLRLPGMQSDRHPDQAIYLGPNPGGPRVWSRWIPDIVVEVVGEGGEDRDYIEKREEYLRAGVREYWILDPRQRRMLVLLRMGDIWKEVSLSEDGIHRTELLPGLEAKAADLLGPPVADPEE